MKGIADVDSDYARSHSIGENGRLRAVAAADHEDPIWSSKATFE